MIKVYALGLLLLLSSCSTPLTTQSIAGEYELHGIKTGRWYAGESIVLKDDTFTYSTFTDVVDDPAEKLFPVSGQFTLNGSTITMHHPLVRRPQRILVRSRGRFVMWDVDQRRKFIKTGARPGDLLYQQR